MKTRVEMMMLDGTRVLRIGSFDKDQNRITIELIEELTTRLDEIEMDEDVRCVVTLGNPKFYSSGLDLGMLLRDRKSAQDLIERFHGLLARIMSFPKLTVAAISGHAVAGGAMLALAHDYTIVVPDKLIFFSEINIGIPFTPGMSALVQCKVSGKRGLCRDLMLLAKRYTGKEAVMEGIFDELYEEESVPLDVGMIAHAIRMVERSKLQKYDPEVLQAIKEEMFKSALRELRHGGLGYGMSVGKAAKL